MSNHDPRSSVVERLQDVRKEQNDIIQLAQSGEEEGEYARRVKASTVLATYNAERDMNSFLRDNYTDNEPLFQGKMSEIVYNSQAIPVRKFFSYTRASHYEQKLQKVRPNSVKKEEVADLADDSRITSRTRHANPGNLQEVYPEEDDSWSDPDFGPADKNYDSEGGIVKPEGLGIDKSDDVTRLIQSLDISSAQPIDPKEYHGLTKRESDRYGTFGSGFQAAYNVYATGQDLRPYNLDALEFKRDCLSLQELCKSDRISAKTKAILARNNVRGQSSVSVSYSIHDLHGDNSTGLHFMKFMYQQTYRTRTSTILLRILRMALLRGDKYMAIKAFICLIRTRTHEIRSYWTLGLQILQYKYPFNSRILQEYLEVLIINHPLTRAAKANSKSDWLEYRADAMYPILFQLKLQTQTNPAQVRDQIETLLYSKEYEDVTPLYLVQCLAILRCADNIDSSNGAEEYQKGHDLLDELKDQLTKAFVRYADLVQMDHSDMEQWVDILVTELERSRQVS